VVVAVNAKLDRERELLRAVYREREFATVEHGDSPDFVLRHHGVSTPFGVEVTEVFETEADARLRFHPEYVGRLLAGGPYMHRDDPSLLPLTSVSIRAPDGTLKAEHVPAILRKTATREQHYDAVAVSLLRKEARAEHYLQDLSHVNLIIGDRFEASDDDGSGRDYAVSDVLVPALRSALLQTRFREVFLVSAKQDGPRRYRPLQQLLLMEAFSLFCKACETFPSADDGGANFEFSEIIPLFMHAHCDAGMDLQASWASGTLLVLYHGAGATLDEHGITVFDFHDRPLPPAIAIPPLRFTPDLLEALDDHLSTSKTAHRFIANFAVHATHKIAEALA